MTEETTRRVRRIHSKWLGPNTRKELFGSEDAGVPRPTAKSFHPEANGWRQGAKVRRT
jgi:hypothetical protein